MEQLRFVIFGLSITSSWGNGHATTYRALVRELEARGHKVLFLERDVPWYAGNRDLPTPPYGTTLLYTSVEEAKDRFARQVAHADVVLVGSYVPDGIAIGNWVLSQAGGMTAFYDIDTPITLSKLERGDCQYISPELVSRYDLYLSFTGGPMLRTIESRFGSPRARVLYCSVDPAGYHPEPARKQWDLGYIGTYSEDRQALLDALLCEPALKWSEGKFIVAGPLYPGTIQWPRNVARVDHIAPPEHRAFYNSQRFTLNLTRSDMARAGYCPSVRLFEAAACGVPIISDWWPGLDTLFQPEKEILIARSPEECLTWLRQLSSAEISAIGERARQRVLSAHTAAHRAADVERYVLDVIGSRSVATRGA
jgi:spore maturation protein CgeB